MALDVALRAAFVFLLGLPRGGVELESLVRPQGRPLNSLDLRGPLVATGSDSEAIFLLTLGRE